MAHILLVDDDRDIRELGRSLLTQSGHIVTLAESGRQALAILKEPARFQPSALNPIELILTDVNMPDISGFELVRAIRMDPRLHAVSIALLTARRDRSDIELAVKLGVRDYIVKPIDPLLFLQKIKDLIPRSSDVSLDGEVAAPEFATTSLRWNSQVSTETEIISLSEIGLSLRSSIQYPPGTKVRLETDLFSKIGIEPPYMKVVDSQPLTSGQFETRITFFGLNESALSKIRAWVQKEVVKNAHSTR